MSDPGTIRAGRPADAPAYAAILNAWIDATPWMPRLHTPQDVMAWHRDTVCPRARVLVAERGGPCGFLVLEAPRADGAAPFVTGFYVAQAVRGLGVGRALLRAAKRAAPEGLRLWTFAANAAARRFYAREGFAEVGGSSGENEEGLPDILCTWPGSLVPASPPPSAAEEEHRV
ncbi:MAG: GNAT family N-acetyltransferase [Pseudomonadota bacterium]